MLVQLMKPFQDTSEFTQDEITAIDHKSIVGLKTVQWGEHLINERYKSC
jgi:hypothetical protein